MEGLSSFQVALLDKEIIDLEGNVDDDMFDYVRKCLAILALRGNPPIQINITSSGGSVKVGLIIYDMLRLYPGKKTGTVNGYARSIALVLLQACDKRECSQHSFVMLHYIGRNIDLEEIDDKQKLRNIVKEMRAGQEKIYLVLEKNSKKPRSVLVSLCKEGRDMPAQAALEFGFIDEIV